MSQTVIVSNRLPVSVRKGENGLEIYPSAGGLATGLASYANKRGNLWIGWPGIVSDDLTETEKTEIVRQLANHNCHPVFLTQKQIDQYYGGYSNSVLWPFLHNLEADFTHQERDWKTYREVNELFSDTVLTLSKPGSVIWVHDYQLLLLPRLLREHRPHDHIGFFLHIPFPSAEHFATLRQAPAIVRGIMGSDLIGFHIKSYAENFLDAAQALTGAAPTRGGLALKERAVRVTDFPIGIDYTKFRDAMNAKRTQRELKRLQKQYRGKKVILTVDRLDPTKGFIERLEAYRTFLAENPQLHGKVVMLMLAVPSRGEVDAYRRLKEDVERLVKDINRTYRTKTWKPIVYMYTSVSFERLSALYQLADVAFVAPIRDGMNLVAKEYVASQGRKKGMLILSRTAGASKELKDALLVNTERPKSLVRALSRAIKMPKEELKQRVASMQNVLSENTIHDWAGDFINTLNKPVHMTKTPDLNKQRQANLVRNYDSALRRLLLLDYDGVLAPFTSRPSDAAPDPELLKTLESIARKKRNTLAIVSGRSKADLEKWLGHLPITLIAEHGAMIRKAGQEWTAMSAHVDTWKAVLLPALRRHAKSAPGAFVEEKDCSVVWHFRDAAPYAAQKQVAIIKSALKPFLRTYGLKLFMGNKIIEIKDPDITKGKTVKTLLTKPYDFILAAGDDYTDEDMFRALPRHAYTLKVGPGRTAARYRIKNIRQIEALLNEL